MSGLSNYMQNSILNYIKGTQMPPPPSLLYVALFNGDPTDSGNGGSEVTNRVRPGGRPRVSFGNIFNNNGFSNSSLVDFGNAVNTTTVSHFAVFDAISGGNLIGTGILGSGGPQIIAQGLALTFSVGSLSIIID